ncbi:MAG: [acyl-carrier-protein] S-malonyltransferase [Omnitrophica WOR_2 bacterium GWA2_47_8]|nr:MAG: [acyl-carrier-protein] S-malonyltransferase [Omnitrophica WOR_2 bacterium GWA2_47_8]
MNISLIFPGQGSQFPGMGKEFYEASPEARAVFDKADAVIPGLKDCIFNGPPEKLTSTAFCQPAIFTFSLAALEAFKAHPKFKNFTPRFACGLSLGELTAVVASGSLSFEEGLRLVQRRSALMDEACRLKKGGMAAVIGFSKEKILEICKQTGAEVANFNSPEQIVITGEAAKVEAASVKIKEAGAKRVIPLDVAGAFHSSLMRPAAEKFKIEIEKFKINPAKFGVVSNVDGRPATDPKEIKEKLSRQITSSVQWVASVEYIAAQGVTTFFELGPGTVLKGLIRKINSSLIVHNIEKPEDLEKF